MYFIKYLSNFEEKKTNQCVEIISQALCILSDFMSLAFIIIINKCVYNFEYSMQLTILTNLNGLRFLFCKGVFLVAQPREKCSIIVCFLIMGKLRKKMKNILCHRYIPVL